MAFMGFLRRFPVNRRKGFTLIELLVVVAIIALLISILLPSLARAREITKRAVCASNLKGVGQGMKVYSNDNADWFPIAPFTENTTQTGNATAIDFIGKMANNLVTINTGTAQLSVVHPSRSLFLLVIDGTCTAKQFICPSSGDGEDDMRNTSGTSVVAAQPGQTRFDFRGYPFLSYGYQMPFGPRAKPNENLDSRTAIAADKGPFYQAGSGATGYTEWTTADTCATNMTMDLAINLNPATQVASEILKADNEKWRPYNSRNHSQEGENVLYQDGHVDFVKKPICGVNYDNIYTIQGPAYTLQNSLLGKTPKQRVGPLTQSDSVIVP
jgi:prepilin-type N-terminal cleavage/methylation domain-containing protein